MTDEERDHGAGERDLRTARRARAKRAYWLLALPVVGLIYPPLYSHEEPVVAGVPFFYWYQLALVLVTGGLTLWVQRMTTADGIEEEG